MKLFQCVYLAVICILYDVRIAVKNGKKSLEAVLYNEEKGFFLGDASELKGLKPIYGFSEGETGESLSGFINEAELNIALDKVLDKLNQTNKMHEEFRKGSFTELGKLLAVQSGAHKEFVEGAFSEACKNTYRLETNLAELCDKFNALAPTTASADKKAPTGNPSETK